MANNSNTYCKSFKSPDETREFKAHGHLDLLNFGQDQAIGRAVFEPGWKWSNDIKPIVGTSSCEAAHTGYCLSGSMTIRMDNGETFRINAGDAFSFPPGHDAWVEGQESCTMLDVTGYDKYAKKAA